MANPYETLGVAPNASQDDIRKAYRKAAKESHPDLNPGKPEAEKRFKEISAAYDVVGDADKRKRYDAGEIDETGAERQPERHFYREYAEADAGSRYSRRGASAGRRGGAGEDSDFDIFADLFRGRGGESATFRMPPQDVRYALEIDFLDAVNGTHKRVVMPDGKTLDITNSCGHQRRAGAPSQRPGTAELRRQTWRRLRRDLGSTAPGLQARGFRHFEHAAGIAWRGAERHKRARRDG